MGSHVNIVEGDFIFYAWKEDEDKRLKETVNELRSLGYEYKESEHDYLNEYRIFENKKQDTKTVTICCL